MRSLKRGTLFRLVRKRKIVREDLIRLRGENIQGPCSGKKLTTSVGYGEPGQKRYKMNLKRACKGQIVPKPCRPW